MDKRNKPALAYLLIGVSAVGRALLSVPENTMMQEVSLTVLAVAGYLLLGSRALRLTVCGGVQLVLELILCGVPTGGVWGWLTPALRAADLWLLWFTVYGMLGLIGKPRRKILLFAALPLAVYTAAHFFVQWATVASAAFILFSLVLIWYAVLLLRAYNAARIKK